MDILQDARELSKKSFFMHVFSSSDEGKAEILNVVQYATLGVLPIVILNKIIHRFIPEADLDKSSLELLVEIILQIIVIFCGIIVIHRIITYVPTYSGFKYDVVNFTNVILAFLTITLSIQSKMGIKTNIIYDRALELWNGTNEPRKRVMKKNVRVSESMVSSHHRPSQADDLDDPPSYMQNPESSTSSSKTASMDNESNNFAPQAANGILGGNFGSLF